MGFLAESWIFTPNHLTWNLKMHSLESRKKSPTSFGVEGFHVTLQGFFVDNFPACKAGWPSKLNASAVVLERAETWSWRR